MSRARLSRSVSQLHRRRGRAGRVVGAATVAALAGAVLVVPIGSAPAGAVSPAPRVAANPCPTGDAQLTFANDSGYGNNDVYGAVTVGGGSVVGATGAAIPLDVSRPLTSYPVDTDDPTGRTVYVCLVSGVSAGRLWISIGSPISGLPSVQPTVSEPYRFGYVEFTYPGDVDYSNVNDFDFPVDLRTYGSGSSTPTDSAVFTATTCQIVGAMHSAVDALGSDADWSSIEKTSGGDFVRIISPSNGTASAGWPDMAAYIRALAATLPLTDGARGPITVEDFYAPSAGNDTQNRGWFDYTGTFDASTDELTLTGTIRAASSPGGSGAVTGAPVTVSLAGLTQGIYDQGHEYDVSGTQDLANDVYARIWNDLTGAFDYGYWGSSYGSGTDTKDFFGTFSPPTVPSGGQVAFGTTRTASYLDVPDGLGYNLYASVLSRFSPSYTFSENENYGAGGSGRNPLLSIPAGGVISATLPNDGWSGSQTSGTCSNGATAGYHLVAGDGGVFSFGTAGFYGSTGNLRLNQPIVGMTPTPDHKGYWLVAADGGIFSFGDAQFYGSTGAMHLNQPVVGMATTPDGRGYWLVAADGGIFSFGDAQFYGSTGNLRLNQPVVGMASAPHGTGYWLVAADGGIFSFGSAGFAGSTGDLRLNQPIVGMAPTTDGRGYWLVAADGGIFTFGDAAFEGSAGGSAPASRVVGMQATADGGGYWMTTASGDVLSFGDAAFEGSAVALALQSPVAGIAP